MAETHGVEFVNGGVTLDVTAGESILDAGGLMELSLPYRRRMGVCEVCCARRDGDGEADQTEGMFLSPEEQRAGYVLACVGKPSSGLQLLTDSGA